MGLRRLIRGRIIKAKIRARKKLAMKHVDETKQKILSTPTLKFDPILGSHFGKEVYVENLLEKMRG